MENEIYNERIAKDSGTRTIDLTVLDYPVRFHVPSENQGQTIEVSYAALDGEILMRRYDRSDRSVTYQIAAATEEEQDREADYWQREPETEGDWTEVQVSGGPNGSVA